MKREERIERVEKLSYTVVEASYATGMSTKEIYEHIAAGHIKVVDRGGSHRRVIRKAELEQFLFDREICEETERQLHHAMSERRIPKPLRAIGR